MALFVVILKPPTPTYKTSLGMFTVKIWFHLNEFCRIFKKHSWKANVLQLEKNYILWTRKLYIVNTQTLYCEHTNSILWTRKLYIVNTQTLYCEHANIFFVLMYACKISLAKQCFYCCMLRKSKYCTGVNFL